MDSWNATLCIGIRFLDALQCQIAQEAFTKIFCDQFLRGRLQEMTVAAFA
jgi:hypothetical protein